jgi:hypothetical protein
MGDVDQYVRTILAHEADDIPQSLIDRFPWCQQFDVDLAALDVDEGMVRRHDRQSVHLRRRDGFLERIRSGEPLPPLIALGGRRRLVDGYARLRALRLLGIASASVCVQAIGTQPP